MKPSSPTSRPRGRAIATIGVPFAFVVPPALSLAAAGAAWRGWPLGVLWLFGCLPLVSLWLGLMRIPASRSGR